MVKNIFITVSIVNAFMNISAMEIQFKKDTSKPCWFLAMPEEILNVIANFLTFKDIESEQEFIDRTKAIRIKPLPDKYYTHIYPSNCHQNDVNLHLVTGNCLNNSFIPVIKEYLDISVPQLLVIIDTKNNTSQNQHLDNNTNSKLTLSCNANMLATIHDKRDNSQGLTQVMNYKSILTIKNITTKETECHTIPDSFSIPFSTDYPGIAFNKQETHIILHGNDSKKSLASKLHADELLENPIQHHVIFPITFNQSTNNKKTLAKYFHQQVVCKNIIEQTVQNK